MLATQGYGLPGTAICTYGYGSGDGSIFVDYLTIYPVKLSIKRNASIKMII